MHKSCVINLNNLLSKSFIVFSTNAFLVFFCEFSYRGVYFLCTPLRFQMYSHHSFFPVYSLIDFRCTPIIVDQKPSTFLSQSCHAHTTYSTRFALVCTRVERKTAELTVINSTDQKRAQNREKITNGDYLTVQSIK